MRQCLMVLFGLAFAAGALASPGTGVAEEAGRISMAVSATDGLDVDPYLGGDFSSMVPTIPDCSDPNGLCADLFPGAGCGSNPNLCHCVQSGPNLRCKLSP